MEEKGGRIGLNIASMLPWSAIPAVGLLIAERMTRMAGYGFWQVLPLRSVSVAGLKRTGIPIRFVEPAWNATTFLGHLRGELGSEGMPTKWQDPLFFQDPAKCECLFGDIIFEMGPMPVWHNGIRIGPNNLVEVLPRLGLTNRNLVAQAENLGGWKPYVLDLRHIRRTGDKGFSFGPWVEALAELLPFTGLIHVQAFDASEWRRFLADEPNTLALMLRFARAKGYTGPFVVEYKPMTTGFGEFVNPFRLVRSLTRVRERVEELI